MSVRDHRWELALAAALAATSVYAATAPARRASASGQVRQVDAASGKIAIEQGQISDLGLPAMTLVYRADPSQLAGLKPGDKVTFTATRESDGQYVAADIKK